MSDLAVSTGITPQQLKKQLEQDQEMRKLITDYIDTNLVEGTDFDKSHVQAEKPTLLKAGSEKICTLLNLDIQFEVDTETHSLFSEIVRQKTVCFKCILVARKTGKRLAEGRGAASTDEKTIHTINTCIKIAQKRAQIDAVLRLAALSGRFAQDEPPQVQQGKDQTEEVLDALKNCKSLTAYKKIAGKINNGEYSIRDDTRATVMDWAKKTMQRLSAPPEVPQVEVPPEKESAEMIEIRIKEFTNEAELDGFYAKIAKGIKSADKLNKVRDAYLSHKKTLTEVQPSLLPSE